jgi:hypothetical protein
MESVRLDCWPLLALYLAIAAIVLSLGFRFRSMIGLRGRRTAPSGRKSDFPPRPHNFRRHCSGEASHADAGRQTRSADLSGLPRAGVARAARPRTPSRRGAFRRRRPIGYRLRVGLCRLAGNEQRGRRWRLRWWRRRMRRVQLNGVDVGLGPRTAQGGPSAVLFSNDENWPALPESNLGPLHSVETRALGS